MKCLYYCTTPSPYGGIVLHLKCIFFLFHTLHERRRAALTHNSINCDVVVTLPKIHDATKFCVLWIYSGRLVCLVSISISPGNPSPGLKKYRYLTASAFIRTPGSYLTSVLGNPLPIV